MRPPRFSPGFKEEAIKQVTERAKYHNAPPVCKPADYKKPHFERLATLWMAARFDATMYRKLIN